MGNAVPGLDDPRAIIRWLYYEKTKIGDVSPVFELDKKFVVAVATEERFKGVVPYDEMRERLKNNVLNEVKGEFIVNKINESGISDIYQISDQMNVSLDTNTTLTFASRNIPGFGSESEVIAKVFTLSPNQNSGPLVGNGAVFVVVLDNISEAPELGSYAMYKSQIVTEFERNVRNNYPYRAIEKNADIEDYRILYY